MTVTEIMAQLQANGSDSIKKTLAKHGVKEPFFGVKIEYLKPIQKMIKRIISWLKIFLLPKMPMRCTWQG